jgi:hypothetical protein
VSVKAAIEIRDVIRVWIEFRAPKKGELTWAVPADATPEEALEHVLVGRDVWSTGEAGFGYHATYSNTPEFEDENEDAGYDSLRTRNIVVHVEHVRTEPQLNNVITRIKLL